MKDSYKEDIGYIKAKLEAIETAQGTTHRVVSDIDGRLRKVETKAALNGAVSGGIVGICIGFLGALFNNKLGGL